MKMICLPLLLGLGLLLSMGCQQPDLRLVNKVKTFDPQWASLNDDLAYLDRNLDLAENRFERDFAEIEGMLGEIPDSLRNRSYRANLAAYDTLIATRDTIRSIFSDTKSTYSETVLEFNEWEQKVMSGEVDHEEGAPTLKTYKATHKRLAHVTDSVTTVLEGTFATHNAILRDLADRVGIFQNFDIKMQ